VSPLQVAALVAFCLSGFAALLYQVIWQRLLVFFTGADVYASTLIVAAFMAGLGIGNLLGGVLADRLSARGALIGFAVAETAIAAYSLFSRWIFYDLMYQHLAVRRLGATVLMAVLSAGLLWPTFFMGVSLPLLAKSLTTTLGAAAAKVGQLYAVNTLGAALGAFATTWLILPAVGLDHGLEVGAALNALCVALVLPFALRRTHAPKVTAAAIQEPLPELDARLPFPVWLLIYAGSGFVALSLEIVWFRLLGVMAKSTAFTFGTLLAIYLTGIAAGAWVGSLLAPRLRRPTMTFLTAQTAIGLLGGMLVAVLVRSTDRVLWLRQYFGSYEPMAVRAQIDQLRAGQVPIEFLLLYFAIPAALLLPPTFLMGFSFPILQRVVQTDFSRLGRRLGSLMLANIAGSVAGTIVTGVVALNVLGTAGTLKALALVSLLFALAMSGAAIRRPAGMVIVAGAVVACALAVRALPDATSLWARLHGAAAERTLAGEDATGLSVLRLEPGTLQSRTTVFVNGVGQSTIPYGDIHTALGMLPALLHPAPRTAAIIGLGSGDTVYGVAGRPELERIVCVEIIAPQLAGLRQLHARQPYGGLQGLLGDPRIQHVAGDGRIFLMHSPAEFDIIEADALRPTSAYSGNLYSEEYFTLVRSRLRRGGLAATWLPSERVHNAFVRVFPYVVSASGVLVGSREPIAIDRDALAARIADPRVREHFARAGINVQEMMSLYLAQPAIYTPEFNRDGLIDFNSDLFPKDEFDLSSLAGSR
jgi:predicted membrane-bound spermidine synthase